MTGTKRVRKTTITLTMTESEARRLSLILTWAMTKLSPGGNLYTFVAEVRDTLRRTLLEG